MAAQRTRKHIQAKLEGIIQQQFEIISPQLSDLRALDKIASYDVLQQLVKEGKLVDFDGAHYVHIIKDLSDDIQELSGVFVAPHASIQAWKYARPLICLDGGHFSSEQGGILLIVYTLDDDVTPEDLDVWHYFCTEHLRQNVERQFGKEIAKLFMKAALVKMIIEFNTTLDLIQSKKPGAAEYIHEIPADRYAYCAVPLKEFPQFFHMTLNIAESLNFIFKPARKMSWLMALDHIWHTWLEKMTER